MSLPVWAEPPQRKMALGDPGLDLRYHCVAYCFRRLLVLRVGIRQLRQALRSLGAVIVLLFWLYLAFYIVLLGAEINAEAERSRELRRGEAAEVELQAPAKT